MFKKWFKIKGFKSKSFPLSFYLKDRKNMLVLRNSCADMYLFLFLKFHTSTKPIQTKFNQTNQTWPNQIKPNSTLYKTLSYLKGFEMSKTKSAAQLLYGPVLVYICKLEVADVQQKTKSQEKQCEWLATFIENCSNIADVRLAPAPACVTAAVAAANMLDCFWSLF